MTGSTKKEVPAAVQSVMSGFEPATIMKVGQIQAQVVAEVKPGISRKLVIIEEWEKRRIPGESDENLWLRMRRETEEQDRDLPYQAVK